MDLFLKLKNNYNNYLLIFLQTLSKELAVANKSSSNF
jgi:hypothetical protein